MTVEIKELAKLNKKVQKVEGITPPDSKAIKFSFDGKEWQGASKICTTGSKRKQFDEAKVIYASKMPSEHQLKRDIRPANFTKIVILG